MRLTSSKLRSCALEESEQVSAAGVARGCGRERTNLGPEGSFLLVVPQFGDRRRAMLSYRCQDFGDRGRWRFRAYYVVLEHFAQVARQLLLLELPENI